MGEKKVIIRRMIENENYVDYNKRPLKLFGYHFVKLEVAGATVSKARLLAAPNTAKSIVESDCVIALRYQITQLIERVECDKSNQVKQIDKSVKNVNNEEKAKPRRKS